MKTTCILLLLPQVLVMVLPFQGWQVMCLYVGLMYACLKVATWSVEGRSCDGCLFYSIAWVGMNPAEFNQSNRKEVHFQSGTISLLVGLIMIILCMQQGDTMYRASLLFIAMFFVFHFGLLDLNARFWQYLGRGVRPIMSRPWLAVTLTEFWGRRWNMAFRDAAHLLIFKPLAKKCGVRLAAFAVFVFSGIVHEAVISIPAGGGYGGPFVYFILQFCGVQLQRKYESLANRVVTWLLLLCPLPMLFHQEFLENVFYPLSNIMGG